MNKQLKYIFHFLFLDSIFSIVYALPFIIFNININFIYLIPSILFGGYVSHLIFEEKIQLSFLFAWYDMWIGAFWDSKKKWLYILPFPCIGFILKFKTTINNE